MAQRAPHPFPDDAVRREFLSVLRSRLEDEAILGAPSVRACLGIPDEPNALFVERLRGEIENAADALPLDLRPAGQLLVGVDPRTKRDRIVKRGEILRMEASVTKRLRRAGDADPPVDPRTMHTREETDLAPAIWRLLTGATAPRSFVCRDVAVEVRLSSHEPDYLNMAVAQTASYRAAYWIVAITDDLALSDHLPLLVPKVNEVICLSTGSPMPELDLRWRSSERSPWSKPLTFKTLSTIEASGLLAEQSIMDAPLEVVWRVAELPTTPAPSDPRIRLQNELRIPLAARYCYWSASQRLHLREIVFDAAAFPDREAYGFRLQPFLGCHTVTLPSEETGCFGFEANSWLEPGHGAALIWGDPRPTSDDS